MAVSPLSTLTCKRCLPPHSPAPLHAMSINIPSPRLRLSLSRNSLVSIGAVSPTNITSFGHNYSHDLSAEEQLSQDPFTNDYAKYHQPDQATSYPCSTTPARKAPQVCRPDLSPRVELGSSHISRYAVQGGSDASGSSMADSDTYVFGYAGSDEVYDVVPSNEEDPDLTSVLTPDYSRPTTSQSFNSDWIRDRFEMVTPESRSFSNTLRDQGADAPEWEDLSSLNNDYSSSSELDPTTTAATSQSLPADEDSLPEHDECAMSFGESLPISGVNTVISTAEATSVVEEPDVTSSDSSSLPRDGQSSTFPRRLSRLVSRRVNAVLGSGRRAESQVGAGPAVPELAPTRRRRYTLSIEVEVDVPSDEPHHRPPPPPLSPLPLSADSQAQAQTQAPLFRSSSSSSVPTPPAAAAPALPPPPPPLPPLPHPSHRHLPCTSNVNGTLWRDSCVKSDAGRLPPSCPANGTDSTDCVEPPEKAIYDKAPPHSITPPVYICFKDPVTYPPSSTSWNPPPTTLCIPGFQISGICEGGWILKKSNSVAGHSIMLYSVGFFFLSLKVTAWSMGHGVERVPREHEKQIGSLEEDGRVKEQQGGGEEMRNRRPWEKGGGEFEGWNSGNAGNAGMLERQSKKKGGDRSGVRTTTRKHGPELTTESDRIDRIDRIDKIFRTV
ncbi:hypothetical protein BS47DRAFT_1362661 [Hydnum rufescens UP504]|uniref:Uncharacterized protein n=1 Tax=Hydnum rufescens UP504 TaxID=1448309 RepID=A0A9P6DVW3_9AGAM|nr:hypothetical protein BS47DRAFT_1362661 [Hydnum rufescens UP504]